MTVLQAQGAAYLMESNPSMDAVIDRLRIAARAEGKLGRAQAMLVYALGRAGKKEAATKELAALRTPTHGRSLQRADGHDQDQWQLAFLGPPYDPPKILAQVVHGRTQLCLTDPGIRELIGGIRRLPVQGDD